MKLPFRIVCEMIIGPDESGDRTKIDAKILYVCDRKKCETCHEECHLTHDIHHAKRFEFGEEVVLHG